MSDLDQAVETTQAVHAFLRQAGMVAVKADELDALREDKARMDWLDSYAATKNNVFLSMAFPMPARTMIDGARNK